MGRSGAAASTSPGVQGVSTEDVVHHCKCTMDAGQSLLRSVLMTKTGKQI